MINRFIFGHGVVIYYIFHHLPYNKACFFFFFFLFFFFVFFFCFFFFKRKIENFSGKFLIFFLIFAQDINCFEAQIRKIGIPLHSGGFRGGSRGSLEPPSGPKLFHFHGIF